MKEKKTLLAIFSACGFALLVKLFFLDMIIVEGPSMEPSFHSGSIVLLLRSAYGLRFPLGRNYIIHWAKPAENDIIVFITPDGVDAIKRVVNVDDYNGKFFAEGDNAKDSYDSRFYGSLQIDNILGKVIWPINRD
ncbi:MAG: signal peptidase I [Spirochaetaceae bacterium]|nr:signal peptidase I [Spirochaetaceae bacterium]